MRRLHLISARTIGTMLVLLLAMSAPASAGGSWLYPTEDRYSPGDQAELSGDFGHGQLGWLEDGPFFAFLRVDPAAVEASEPDTWPYIHSTDLSLGEINFEPGGFGLIATVSFTVPDLPTGSYEVVYCNDPCDNGIGDLIGGEITIEQNAVQSPVTNEVNDQSTAIADGVTSPNRLLIGLAAAIAVAVTAVALRRRNMFPGSAAPAS